MQNWHQWWFSLARSSLLHSVSVSADCRFYWTVGSLLRFYPVIHITNSLYAITPIVKFFIIARFIKNNVFRISSSNIIPTLFFRSSFFLVNFTAEKYNTIIYGEGSCIYKEIFQSGKEIEYEKSRRLQKSHSRRMRADRT